MTTNAGNDDTTNFIDTSTDHGREILRQENQDALSDVNDNTGQQDHNRSNERHDDKRDDRIDPETGQQARMSPGDSARDAIAKRFRRSESVPYNGNPNDPEMLYGDVARTHQEPEPDVDETIISGDRREARPEPQVEQQQQPQKRKLIIRGQEVYLTEEEILARASMVTAADSYLEEARSILNEAKTVKAERAGQRSQHPENRSGTQDEELDAPTDGDARHPENRTREVVEKIQFGDPEEAAAELDRLIDERADKKTDERQIKRLMDNDLSKSQKALKDFVAANPELNGDKMAARAIEQTLYDIYEEDIVKLGVVDADKIPKDPQKKAEWHRFYRVHGHPVKTAAEALEEAKTRVLRWRGNPAPAQQQQRKAPDRVDVNVNRTERRAAIPNSPSRTVSPRPDSAAAPKATSRSDVIAGMRKARGQLTA